MSDDGFGFIVGIVTMLVLDLVFPVKDTKLATKFEAAQKQINMLQQQINDYVNETGKGEWVCSFGGKTLVYDGGKLNNQEDLHQIVEAGLAAKSCRARLITAGRPAPTGLKK
ncbi:MAG: hypothetical protein P4M13_08940 [Alphaproteobacteria bacterium]|nr:hypothetical protein [Alphaproteobacteria bacterium]